MNDSQNIPTCIGIILDGNRRWAKANGLPELEGHRRGYERLIECARWVRDRGIKHFVVYAFSTENWEREEKEIAHIMAIAQEALLHDAPKLSKEGFAIRFIGDRGRLAPDIQKSMSDVEHESAHNDRLTLWVCLSYGSRGEIVAAVRAICKANVEITEELLSKHLWSATMPDPDLIIRTGGEKRLSNFLLWQAAYSELFFIDPYWPDFSQLDLDNVLKEFTTRTRRFGV